MQVLGLDVGTSSVKAAVLDADRAEPCGPIIRRSYPLHQTSADHATLDPEELWQAVVAAARDAGDGFDIEAVGLSCLSPALILLDREYRPITPIVTHLDRRSRSVARRVWNEVGGEFLQTTGSKPLPGGTTAVTFLAITEAEPELRRLVRHYLHVNGWLGWRLTGRSGFDKGNACFAGLVELNAPDRWSRRWLDYFQIEAAWLPPIIGGEETLADLQPQAASAMGLSPGVPVKIGTADTGSAMLAAGVRAGDLMHVVGTTQVLAAVVPKPAPAENRITRLLGVGDAVIAVTHNPVGGIALDWMHQLCFRDQSETQYYDETIPDAIGRRTGVELEPPFLGGDRLEIEPRFAGFRNLQLATDRTDLLAALLHAMQQHHRTASTALGLGTPFRRVFLTGRAAAVVRSLLPEYRDGDVTLIDEASLRGIARLFSPET